MSNCFKGFCFCQRQSLLWSRPNISLWTYIYQFVHHFNIKQSKVWAIVDYNCFSATQTNSFGSVGTKKVLIYSYVGFKILGH